MTLPSAKSKPRSITQEIVAKPEASRNHVNEPHEENECARSTSGAWHSGQQSKVFGKYGIPRRGKGKRPVALVSAQTLKMCQLASVQFDHDTSFLNTSCLLWKSGYGHFALPSACRYACSSRLRRAGSSTCVRYLRATDFRSHLEVRSNSILCSEAHATMSGRRPRRQRT